jgi:hypothetical protein
VRGEGDRGRRTAASEGAHPGARDLTSARATGGAVPDCRAPARPGPLGTTRARGRFHPGATVPWPGRRSCTIAAH